jgi:predicted O-methyltransferase YrrM
LQRYCVVQAGDRAHVQPMTENWKLHFPEQLSEIRRATEAAGFRMASDELTGSLLRGLAASKPKGALLELGTGTGMGTSWLLSGMDAPQ